MVEYLAQKIIPVLVEPLYEVSTFTASEDHAAELYSVQSRFHEDHPGNDESTS